MKTFYLATAMLLSTFAATAQTEQGTTNINGLFGSNGGGQLQSNDAFNNFKLNVGANVGYFVKNNWEIGAGVQFGVFRQKFKPPFDNLPG
jgi:S-formylglutathione hydrolase FrmB